MRSHVVRPRAPLGLWTSHGITSWEFAGNANSLLSESDILGMEPVGLF